MSFRRSLRFRTVFAAPAMVAALLASQTMSLSVAHAAACAPTETVDGSAKILEFSSAGTCQWTVPAGVSTVDVLIVGGGGGGSADVGGGGGGGQVVASSNVAVSGTVNITVGAGGAAGYNRVGNPTGGGRMGGSSSFVVGASTTIAKGGSGAIGRYDADNLNADGTPNNSGYTGGGGAYEDTAATATGSTGTGGASYKGGNGSGSGGGGGGGAGGAGAPRSTTAIGGVGLSSTITGATVFYGGGGGGGGYGPAGGAGGSGGGGAGGTTNAVTNGISGTNGLGGGGGGAGSDGSPTGRGGHGGSGVVIVRYSAPVVPVNSVVPVVTGTLQSGDVLSATSGTWSNSPTAYSYQWKRAASSSGAYSNIASANSSTYMLIADDVAKYLKVEVVASNSSGPGTAVLSAFVGPVAAAAATTTTAPPALEIVVVAPSTTVPVGQSQIPKTSTPVITAAPKSSVSATTTPVATTTTAPTSPTSTVAPKAPSAPSVVAGSAAVKIGDKTESATVERADNQLVVSAGALKAVVGGLNPDGSQMSLDDDGNVRLNTGDTIRIKLAGFKPGAIMEAWLFSTPVLLGTTKVGADGTVTGTFAIPKDAPEGAHRVVIVAQTTDGQPATLAVGINVGEWDSGPGVAIWLIVLPIALAVVGALVVPAQRRRRRAIQA